MDTNENKRKPRTGKTPPTGKTSPKTAGRGSASAKQPVKRNQSAQTAKSRKPATPAAAEQKKRSPKMAAVSQRRTQKRQQPVREKPQPLPDVVYTPPKPFSRNQVLLRLATVVAVVLALIFGMSIFFKVETITVSGMDNYSAWTVAEASGIEKGDNLLTLSKAKIVGKIKTALPYVNQVRISRELPDTVHIEITEFDVAYSIKDGQGRWWLMTSQGGVLEQVDNATAGDYTTITGVTLESPRVGFQAEAQEEPRKPGTDAETTVITVYGKDRLAAALSILQYLEQNGIVGDAASVDVTDLAEMELWYGNRFQVLLGDETQLSYKITCMKKAIDSLASYESGILDVSFTVVKDKTMYTRFE